MRRDLLLLGLGATLLFVLGIGRADLFNPDEPREAELAREMDAGGDRLVPRLDGRPFLEKPPLFYWLEVAAFRAAGGPGEAAARVVPAVCALLTVLATYLFGRALLGREAAFLGALVLATSFEFFWVARRALIDMPLTLALLLGCAGLHRGLCGRRASRAGDAAGAGRDLAGDAALLGAGAAVACALLLKGIVGAGIPALAALAWVVARRRPRALLNPALLAAALLAVAPVSLWAIRLGAALGPDAQREFVLVNNVERFTGGASKGHDNPFWYYLPTLAADFAPWSLVLPSALWAAWRVSRGRATAAGAGSRPDGGARAAAPAAGGAPVGAAFEEPARHRALGDLLLWFAVPLAVLSIASTKRGLYLVPLYPPAALLCGHWLVAGVSALGPRTRAAARWLIAGPPLALALAVAVLLPLARPGDRVALVAGAVLGGGAAAIVLSAARSKDFGRLGAAAAVAAGLLEIAAATLIVPAVVNGGTSAREAGRVLRARAEAGDRVVFYRVKEGSLGGLLFYSGRTFPLLDSPEDLRLHLEADDAAGPRALAFLRATEMSAAAADLPFPLVPWRRIKIRSAPWERPGSNDYLLVRRGP